MKYAIYCRKSSESEERQALSLEAQERELIALAKKHNLNVVEIFKESMSAKSVGRPVFNKMMEQIEKGKIDAIISWKIDRLARNFIDGGKLMDLLGSSKIKEIRTIEGIHLPSDNVLLMSLLFGSANQYVRDLSVNVKRGNKEKLTQGGWPNHAPFGYLNEKANKTIIIDPVRSKYVPRAFELYTTGTHGFQLISDILYEEGLRTRSGKKVLKSHIQRILSCVFYTGFMERNKQFYQGKHKPLISKQTFDLAQDVMHNRLHPRPKHLFFPLRGFLSCDNCGCTLTSSVKKGHHYYYCTNGKQKCPQHKSYMREIYLYDIISSILGKLEFSERKIELMYQAAKAKSEAGNNYFETTLKDLKTQQESLKTKESKLLDAFLSDQIPKDVYDKKCIEFKNELTSLNMQIKDLESKEPSATLEPVKNIFLQASRAQKEFLIADDMKKRKIVESILWNLSFRDKNMASLKLKSPFEVLYNAPKNGDLSTLLPDLDSNQDNILQRDVSYH